MPPRLKNPPIYKMQDENNSISQPHRLDQLFIPLSCGNQAPRRLSNDKIIRLRHNDEFILLIPPTTLKDPKSFINVCNNTADKMRKMIQHEYHKQSTPEERDEYLIRVPTVHEHRMHRQVVIWRQFYGCVLQAFQTKTGTLRINGNPVKNNLQSHEALLELCYKSLKRHGMDRFLEKHGDYCIAEL